MTFLFVLLGLACLYLWLRGWWFAGLLMFLAYGIGGTQRWGHSWIAAIVIGFGPWLIWKYVGQVRRNRGVVLGSTALITLRSASRDSGRATY